MQITLLTIGRCRDRALIEMAARYADRIARYATFEARELREESAASRSRDDVLAREGRRLLDACPPNAAVIALDAAGETLDSEQFARKLEHQAVHGVSRVTLLVGGAFGLSQEVIHRADWRLSLSPMTMPHELARVVLLEQLYRAFTIIRGESYHK